MNVPGYIVHGRDRGRTAILCPREVNHFRRSWIDQERRTRILGSSMSLSVYMPYSSRDEKDCIEPLETVRNVMTEEGRMAGPLRYHWRGPPGAGQHRIVWYL